MWFQVQNLPICKLNAQNAKIIGSFMGRFLDYEVGGATRKMGLNTMWIHVSLSVLDKIFTRFFLEREGKQRVWIPFRYERLADFCYSCGSFLHTETNCDDFEGQMIGPRDPSKAYGPWVRLGFGSCISKSPLNGDSPRVAEEFRENILPESKNLNKVQHLLHPLLWIVGTRR